MSLRMLVGSGAGHEALALLGHLRGVLLAHGAAQQIRFSERIAGDDVGDLHHLFLVDHDAERLAQNGLQFRQQSYSTARASPLALDEVVDHAPIGPGAVERIQGGQVFDAVGLVAAQHVAHAAGFKLKDARGERAMEDLLIRLARHRARWWRDRGRRPWWI